MDQKQHSPIKRKGNNQLEKIATINGKKKCNKKIKQRKKFRLFVDSNYNYIVIFMVGKSKVIFQWIF